MKKLVLASLLAGTVMLPGTANAAITIYTNQASFLAAISNAGVDTFNNLDFGDDYNSPLNRTAGSYGYRASASGGFEITGSNADEWLSTDDNRETITFSNLTGGVFGFGGNFFLVDGDGDVNSGQITVSATDASGTTSSSISSPGSNSFVGFVSNTGILGASVSTQSNRRYTTVNNLTLGGAASAVPEPATWAMMIVGLGIVGASLRRSRRTTPQVRFTFA